MSEGNPLIISLIFLFTIGLILPLSISPFIEPQSYNHESIISPIVTFITLGIPTPNSIESILGLGDGHTDVLGWLPSIIKQFIISQFSAFTYIPDLLAVPLIILFTISFGYTILKLIRG